MPEIDKKVLNFESVEIAESSQNEQAEEALSAVCSSLPAQRKRGVRLAYGRLESNAPPVFVAGQVTGSPHLKPTLAVFSTCAQPA